ncbi:MAG: endopeptidase La [Candidatus Aminicenantes bacterium]|nr:endopeptidase La [Candidatus Aminicenantes bacterium]
MDSLKKKEYVLPLIPLRELVTFPSTIIPILVGREKSINSLKYSIDKYDHFIFLSVQKNQLSEIPSPEEIHQIGVIARIEKSAEQNNGSFRVVIQGLERGRIDQFIEKDDHYLVKVSVLDQIVPKERNLYALSKNIVAVFEEYINLKKIKLHGIISKLHANEISEIADIIASVINLGLKQRQSLLEELDVYKRGLKIFNILKKEIYKLKTSGETEFKKNREDIQDNDIEEYKRKLKNANLPDYVKKRADEELERLSMMPPYSAESTVSRYYLDWIISIPWQRIKTENNDIKKASIILDEDHYGLFKVKERILDYLAVRQLVKKASGEILCFVGPPGVGKSSLSKSIARALNRAFVRISLGGVKDEAEIRGHRRTYIGSYPGQIVKGLKKAKYINPVFLLDEVDKLSSDFRGDPASALMEVLDPDQNSEFVDHYLDLEIDLSQVFFITTANTEEPIPPALKDRMEVIEIPGYTEREKLHIAKGFLIKKQAEKNGLNPDNIVIKDEILLKIINDYTREAGVRNLEREIAIVMRKIARHFVESKQENKETRKFMLEESNLKKFLGVQKFIRLKRLSENEVGVATGLAWTVSGGDILIIESRFLRGKGDLILTGRLGEIMKESSSAAFSYAKLKLFEMDMDTEELEGYNIHLHIPEGAVPKEGPSAGVPLSVSIISLLTGIPVESDYAMTGEITLRGKVLPVGGIKEKIIAAHRYGIKHIIIPIENEKDVAEDIPLDIQEEIKIHLVEDMDEVLDIVLEKPIKIKNINSKVIKPFFNSKIQ